MINRSLDSLLVVVVPARHARILQKQERDGAEKTIPAPKFHSLALST